MEKVVQFFSSFEDAEAADREYYRSLTPEQRLRILFSIVASAEASEHEAQQRFQRVYRIIERSRR